MAEKSVWDKFKDGFKPAHVRADEQVMDSRREYSQPAPKPDLSQSGEDIVRRAREGFINKLKTK